MGSKRGHFDSLPMLWSRTLRGAHESNVNVNKVRKARNDYHFQGGAKSSESVGAVAPLKLNKRPSSLTSSSAQKGKKGHLDVLFIMSNDHTEWLDDLKREFMKDGWARIITSRDLRLNAEQKEVSVAVDMDIGRRSAVFIGNGVSMYFLLSRECPLTSLIPSGLHLLATSSIGG